MTENQHLPTVVTQPSEECREVAVTEATSAADADGSSDATQGGGQPTGAKQFMRANAGLRDWSASQFLLWLVLTVVVQLSWGLYGVCTRYLQVNTAKPIPTLQLMVCLNLLAWPGMILFCTIPNWVLARHMARREARLAAAEASEASGDAASTTPPADQAPKVDEEAAAAAAAEPAPPKPPLKQRLWAWMRSGGVAYGIASLAVFQALTQVYASKLANAYVSQMVMMFAPAFAAIANTLVLKQPTPHALWPTVGLTIGGAVLVIVGQLQQNAETPGSTTPTTANLILGCFLALISTLLLTAYLVFIQVTRHLVSGEAVLWAKRNVGLLIFIPLSFIFYGTDWSWVAALSPAGWGVLMFTGIYIYTLMNIFLQFCTRALGAALISTFLSLRLVSSVVGSIVLLHETPNQAITWVGLGVVTVVTALFVVLQQRHKHRKAMQAAAVTAAEDARLAAMETSTAGSTELEAGGAGTTGGSGPGAAGWAVMGVPMPGSTAAILSAASFMVPTKPRDMGWEQSAVTRRRLLHRASAPPATSSLPFFEAVGVMSDSGYSPPDEDEEEAEEDTAVDPRQPPARPGCDA